MSCRCCTALSSEWKVFCNKKIRAAAEEGAPNLPDGNIHGQPSKSDEEETTGAGYLTRGQGIFFGSPEK